MHLRSRLLCTTLLVLAFFVLPSVVVAQPPAASTARETLAPTALDRYVYAPDPHFAYRLVDTRETTEWTAYIIELTSQAWRTPEEVDRPVWKHWLTIIMPREVAHNSALLYISGGRNGADPPKAPDPMVVQIARQTRSVAAALNQVPSQPLRFADETRSRSEDATIAYTWEKYMLTGDETWPLRLPMTKSAVRAMDVIQAFCADPERGSINIAGFVVAGGSKRGWTTWTTAVVDKRVVAIAPAVIDLLNLVPSFRHHWAAYGEWAPAIDDYVEMRIMEWLDTPEFAALMRLVEPYEYRDRLTMPKLIMNGTQDEFFLPDSSLFYIDDLKGPTYLRYVPNVGHALMPSDAPLGLLAFHQAVISGARLPEYAWSFPDANTVRAETRDKPVSVKLWWATNPEAREYRTYKVGAVWSGAELAPAEPGVYVGHVETPEKGWTAYMVELTFSAADGFSHVFTTPVRVVPETTPYTYVTPENPPKGFLKNGDRADASAA